MVPSKLIELGQQVLTDVRVGVANGEPLVRCQLLTSEFYEALKRALRAPELSPVERWAVMAAANQCLHAADASISPGTVALVGINRVRGQRNPGDWKIGMRSPDLGASTRKRLLWCVVRCTC